MAWVRYEEAQAKADKETADKEDVAVPVKSLPHVFNRSLGLLEATVPEDEEELWANCEKHRECYLESHELLANWLDGESTIEYDESQVDDSVSPVAKKDKRKRQKTAEIILDGHWHNQVPKGPRDIHVRFVLDDNTVLTRTVRKAERFVGLEKREAHYWPRVRHRFTFDSNFKSVFA